MEAQKTVDWLDQLKSALVITNAKGDIRQPQNHAMDRIAEGYSRWWTASQYFYDIERILKEMKVAASFASTIPDASFFAAHTITPEDYIMYHQGYFLDLVHQLKDKLCQMTKAIVTPAKNYSRKDEKDAAEIRKLIANPYVMKIAGLATALGEWDDSTHNGTIAIVLKKRTFYHHFKNPLPADKSYMDAKLSRFMQSTSFQANLSDYGRQFFAEKGESSLAAWQSETKRKMSETLNAIEANIQGVARSLITYFKLPKNDGVGARILKQYADLDERIKVSSARRGRDSLDPAFNKALETLEEFLWTTWGEEIASIYVVGSTTRSEFLLYLSDINFVVVTKNANEARDAEIRGVLNEPFDRARIPISTEATVLTLDEFKSPSSEKIRFICRTDGVLLNAEDSLPSEWARKKCYKLAWLLNEDFKEALLAAKKKVLEDGVSLSDFDRAMLARQIAKRAYHMSFSMVIGNHGGYAIGFKAMRQLNNFYYPDTNRAFNERMYMLITRRIDVSLEALVAVIETCEKNLLPLYEAVDHVVNGVKSE